MVRRYRYRSEHSRCLQCDIRRRRHLRFLLSTSSSSLSFVTSTRQVVCLTPAWPATWPPLWSFPLQFLRPLWVVPTIPRYKCYNNNCIKMPVPFRVPLAAVATAIWALSWHLLTLFSGPQLSSFLLSALLFVTSQRQVVRLSIWPPICFFPLPFLRPL